MDPAAEFASITGSDVATGRQFLEASGGDLNAAITAFLDSGSSSAPAAGSQAQPQPTKKQAPKKRTGGPMTFADLRGGDDDEDDDDDAPQQKYTGGHASGMMVQDHPRDKKPKSEVESLFERAEKEGQKHAQEHQAAKEAAGSGSNLFRGGGYALGDNESGSRAVVPPSGGAAGDESGGEKMITITFWRGGFTIEDGPFRSLEDPANAEFLSAINRGMVPRELGNQNIAVSLKDNRKEDYVPPPVTLKPFQGGGQRLGTTIEAPVAGGTGNAGSTATPATTVPADSGADPSKGEVTSIQIRLHDGTRLVAKFNLSQTVGDIRNFINSARPECASLAYDLQLTFPRKLLEDNSATVESAGLKGAVIVQAKK